MKLAIIIFLTVVMTSSLTLVLTLPKIKSIISEAPTVDIPPKVMEELKENKFKGISHITATLDDGTEKIIDWNHEEATERAQDINFLSLFVDHHIISYLYSIPCSKLADIKDNPLPSWTKGDINKCRPGIITYGDSGNFGKHCHCYPYN